MKENIIKLNIKWLRHLIMGAIILVVFLTIKLDGGFKLDNTVDIVSTLMIVFFTLYMLYLSTIEVYITKQKIILRRFFGLLSNINLYNETIEKVFIKTDYNNELIAFNVIFKNKKKVNLTYYHTNFKEAVSFIKTNYPNLEIKEYSKFEFYK